jgi:undecaprenyl-diphosphatase
VTESEVQRIVVVLAEHAVLLLGLGIVAALIALALVAAAVGLLRRHRQQMRDAFTSLLRLARRVDLVDRSFTHATSFVPPAYLALHLTFGLVLTAAAAAFVVVAEEAIGGGDIAAFDVALAAALREAATPEWERFFATVSWLGEREAIAVLTLAGAVAFYLRHGAVVAGVWIAAQAGGGVLNLALKQTFERTRPEFADPLLAASSWSFPSGHAMGTFILVGLGCYLLLRDVGSWGAAALLVVLALAWCVVMSFSRMYLGVHYASDVLAGMIAGAAWVAVCASAFEVIRRRGSRKLG